MPVFNLVKVQLKFSPNPFEIMCFRGYRAYPDRGPKAKILLINARLSRSDPIASDPISQHRNTIGAKMIALHNFIMSN